MISTITRQITKWLPLFVAACGMACIIGWFTNTHWLLTFGFSPITMKLTAAISLLMSGVLVFLIRGNGIGPRSQFLGAGLCFWMLGLSITIMSTKLFNTDIGIDRFLVRDLTATPYAQLPGEPSLFTVAVIVLSSLAGIAWIFNKRQLIRCVFGGVVVLSGIALLGHFFNRPTWYGYHPHFSNGMAINAAILFLLLGLSGMGRAVLGKTHENDSVDDELEAT